MVLSRFLNQYRVNRPIGQLSYIETVGYKGLSAILSLGDISSYIKTSNKGQSPVETGSSPNVLFGEFAMNIYSSTISLTVSAPSAVCQLLRYIRNGGMESVQVHKNRDPG
jgi:hypothetical protein